MSTRHDNHDKTSRTPRPVVDTTPIGWSLFLVIVVDLESLWQPTHEFIIISKVNILNKFGIILELFVNFIEAYMSDIFVDITDLIVPMSQEDEMIKDNVRKSKNLTVPIQRSSYHEWSASVHSL